MKNVFQFGTGYKVFSSYWWRHWLRLRTYYDPFVYAYHRVTRGWADCDTWSLDEWFADVMPEALEHLRKTKQGVPLDLSEEQWDAIMVEMIEGFRAYTRVECLPEEFVQRLDTSTGWRAQIGINDSVYDWENIRVYQEAELSKFRRGMKLLTEHFPSLWD